MKKLTIIIFIPILLLSCKKNGTAPEPPEETTAQQFQLVPGSTKKVYQVVGELDFETGQPTLSRTITQCNLLGTDGGNSFEFKGKLWIFFGDSDHPFPVQSEMENLNSMAWVTVEDPLQLTLQFLTDSDRIPGKTAWKAPVLLSSQGQQLQLQAFNTQLDGFSDGNDLYLLWSLDFMSRSMLSKTSDPADTFHEIYELGRTHFINADIVERSNLSLSGLEQFNNTDWIFFYGSGTAQNKHVYLAATPRDRLRSGDRNSVYFLSSYDLTKQEPVLTWSKNEGDAAPLFLIEGNGFDYTMGPFHSPWGGTEPNVSYNKELELYLAMYTDLFNVRVRTSKYPWGPWSKPVIVFDPFKDYGYGAAFGNFIHSAHLSNGETLKAGDCAGGNHHPVCDKAHNDGQEAEGGGVYGAWMIEKFTKVAAGGNVTLYFLLSTQNPYTVVLMTTELQPK